MNPIQALREAGVETPEREWRILERHFEGKALETALRARLNRQPMAQILGFRAFWKDEFIVTKDTLDPRPDSELFLEITTSKARDFARILDMGTGTGALGLSLLREFPKANAVLSDNSIAALDIAKRNAQRLALDGRVECVQSNWLERVEGEFDLIVCNPPYLSSDEWLHAQAELLHEPKMALTDDADGLATYRNIAPKLKAVLKLDGIALFEHGSKQQEAVAEIFKTEGFEIKKHRDLSQNPRIIEVFTRK